MDRLKSILREYYALEPHRISPMKGGWSALAYKVECKGCSYFLKVYEKKNAGTAYWTALLDEYMPVLAWLSQETALTGRVPNPVPTRECRWYCRDAGCIYVLFDFINGETMGDQTLSHQQVLELARIMAELHKLGTLMPFHIPGIEEDFSLPFLEKLKMFLTGGLPLSPPDLCEAALPHARLLLRAATEAEELAHALKRCEPAKTLCHTDAHGFNVMHSGHLILIDWEGMRLAPAEADLFMFCGQESWDTFYTEYANRRGGYALDSLALRYYVLRRLLEDIWAFAERLLYDGLSGEQRANALKYLRFGCEQLKDERFWG